METPSAKKESTKLNSELYTFHEPHAAIFAQLIELYADLFQHEGCGELTIEMRYLKRGQKEVVINYGKEYRFTVDYNDSNKPVFTKKGA